ncbi:uncharacterized protein BJX67DRAFT_387830 [Aspergillus lucknowensis]|uniref:Uncharacterized protein n=1 Tax=Aspergillus lucknowensis TaxID=176173 RepID=A0ABR4LSS3_9EURO
MSRPSFPELEAAAGAVIRILQTMPEFSNSKIAVIGGLGLWKYLRNYRTTEGAPQAVKDKLLAIPSFPFQQRAQLFVYKASNGKLTQIDITPDWQSPYVPSAALPVSAVRPNALPYISELDLLVFKINSCGLRPTAGKKIRDANDVMELTEHLSSQGPIMLSSLQKDVVRQGLNDVVQLSARDRAWWMAKLALN